MSAITFDRDGVSVTAHTLTEASDSHTYLIKSEHSDSKPSLLEFKRRLPQGSDYRRLTVARRLGVTLDAGTEQERYAMINAKLEISIPVGTPVADLDVIQNDFVGVIGTAQFADLRDYGIVSE